MIHRSIQKILIFVSGSQCTSRPITRSTLTAPRRRSLLHSLQLESGKCVAAGLQSCRLAAGLQLRPSSSSVAKPHVGSSKCRTLEALAAGTWLAYNHASHTFNNDNENDNTQSHPTAQRYHERSNVVMKLTTCTWNLGQCTACCSHKQNIPGSVRICHSVRWLRSNDPRATLDSVRCIA